MTPSDAAKELRQRLRMTQQQFAQETGLSIRSIAKYDTGGQPSGRALFELGNAARKHECFDLAAVFFWHLFGEIGLNQAALLYSVKAGIRGNEDLLSDAGIEIPPSFVLWIPNGSDSWNSDSFATKLVLFLEAVNLSKDRPNAVAAAVASVASEIERQLKSLGVSFDFPPNETGDQEPAQ